MTQVGSPLRVLMVEDDPDDAILTTRVLDQGDWDVQVRRVETVEDLGEALASGPWDVVVCDFSLGSFQAPEALLIVREAAPNVPFIVVSGTVGEEVAAEVMRLGAQDFVMKSNYSRLVPAIRRELAEAETRRRAQGAERKVRESETRFRQIAQTIDEVFWVQSLDASRILFVSEAFERVFGYPPDALHEHPSALSEHVHEDDREALLERIRDVRGYEQEFRFRRPGGALRWIRVRARPMASDGEPMMVVVAEDVTLRHEAEADLRASFEALSHSEQERRALVRQLVRASEEERARLAGDVHDDSVQAMTAVGMRLETLKRRLGADPDRVEEVERLQHTVSDAVARLRHLLFELRPPALDQHGAAAALRESLDRLEVATRLHADGFEEPPLELRTILYRVAQESLTNVRKHAKALQVDITLTSDADGWHALIADDGIGFDPDELALDPTHMGLASMRERAEMGGGWARVESAPGAGTRVEVFLPRPAA